jgi:dihydrofolate reductase
VAALTYLTNVSLDGFIEDSDGSLDWTAPSDEVFAYLADLIRPVGTFLYGRGLYQAMALWETDESLAAQSDLSADFASVWQRADKVVWSTTLSSVATARTTLVRTFDPAAVRELKSSSGGELQVGGARLAAQAFAAGLVDECILVVHPAILGGGKPALPSGVRVDLDLVEERHVANGVVSLRYRVRS